MTNVQVGKWKIFCKQQPVIVHPLTNPSKKTTNRLNNPLAVFHDAYLGESLD